MVEKKKGKIFILHSENFDIKQYCILSVMVTSYFQLLLNRLVEQVV